MADDLSSASIAPRGVDLVAGRAGSFTRGGSTPAQSVNVTATGPFGAPVEVAGHGTVRLDLVTTNGATSLTVAIETSYDRGVTDPWHAVGSFPAVTAGTQRQVFAGLDRWIRPNATASTGPSGVQLSGELV